MPFAKDFLWGAASAAAQIEGAWDADGKCPSIWDVAGRRVKNGDDCHTACDHYRRWREDIELMRRMGLRSYRFSVSMCRVMPEKGRINPAGLAFYAGLAKALRAAGIEPICTLYHWDLPVWAQNKGGWGNAAIRDWFLQYAGAVVDALSGDVRWWITFNEPQSFIMLGYVTGAHAPFERRPLAFRQHHLRNMLAAHGAAVRLIRERAKTPPKIGIAMAATTWIPGSEAPEDVRRAARRSFGHIAGEIANGMYMDPIALGRPSRLLRRALDAEDLKIISEPMDFVGVNVYQPLNGFIDRLGYGAQPRRRTCMGWVVDGRCLYWTIRHFWERYHLPVMVTENGMAAHDALSPDGCCHDPERAAFLDEFIGHMKRAADEGIPLLGYQHWSVMDNFEWCEGYGPRFGLAYVDYDTQRRIIKDSGLYYAGIIRANGENLPEAR